MMINYNLKQGNQLITLRPLALRASTWPLRSQSSPSLFLLFLYGIHVDSQNKKLLTLFEKDPNEGARPTQKDRSCFLLPIQFSLAY